MAYPMGVQIQWGGDTLHCICTPQYRYSGAYLFAPVAATLKMHQSNFADAVGGCMGYPMGVQIQRGGCTLYCTCTPQYRYSGAYLFAPLAATLTIHHSNFADSVGGCLEYILRIYVYGRRYDVTHCNCTPHIQ